MEKELKTFTVDGVEYTEVDSSAVSAVGYKDGDLFVQFRGGNVYRYYGVDERVYREILEAESVGSYVAKNVVGRYGYDLVRRA
jgi:hypothetical protein